MNASLERKMKRLGSTLMDVVLPGTLRGSRAAKPTSVGKSMPIGRDTLAAEEEKEAELPSAQ
jgi:hypothetical protein